MSECIESNVPTLQRMVDCLRDDNARLVGEVKKANENSAYWVEQHGIEAGKRGEAEHEIDLARGPSAEQIERIERKLDEARTDLQRHKDALEKARVALGSSASAWKKMADGLDRVKSEGETSVELGCEVAATFRLHQCGCEHALTTINEVLGEK